MSQKNIFRMFTSESFFCLFPLDNCSSEVLVALVEQLLTCCNTGSHTHLRFMSTAKFTQSKQHIFNQPVGSISISVNTTLITVIPFHHIHFFRKLFTCTAFAFNLSRRGAILDINIFLLSDLQDTADSIFGPI